MPGYSTRIACGRPEIAGFRQEGGSCFVGLVGWPGNKIPPEEAQTAIVIPHGIIDNAFKV